MTASPFHIPALNRQPQIWLINHNKMSAEQRQQLATHLSAQEWQRNKLFRYPAQQYRDQICRGLIRIVLAAHLSLKPQQLSFINNPEGKPRLARPNTNLHFNLSHSGEWLALAIAKECSQLGVDIEHCQRRNDVLSIAERYFAPSELKQLFAQTTVNQRRQFFDYWTLKEAYIKAHGSGLAIPLDKFSFCPSKKPIAFECHPSLHEKPSQWQFFQSTPATNYRLAIATKHMPTNLDPVLIYPYGKGQP